MISSNDEMRDLLAISSPALSIYIDDTGKIALYDANDLSNVDAFGYHFRC